MYQRINIAPTASQMSLVATADHCMYVCTYYYIIRTALNMPKNILLLLANTYLCAYCIKHSKI